MRDPWTSMLTSLEPSYDKWKDIMDNDIKIAAYLDKRKSRWWITIHEDWDKTLADLQYRYYIASDSKLITCTEWTEKQLKDWKLVSRQSDCQWAFIRKADAEKFITLFNLRWIE